VVALLIGLKLQLLRNRLRAEVWVLVGLVVGALFGLGAAVLAGAGAVALRAVSAGTAGTVVVIAGSILIGGWAIMPVLAFGIDETLDPSRFVTLPVRARELLPGLAVAGAIGVPGVATAVVCVATVGTWSRGLLSTMLAALAAPVALATCVLASRAVTTAAAQVFTRRTREMTAVLSVVAFIGLTMIPSLIAGSGMTEEVDAGSFDRVAEVLGWTPLGLVWAAPADAATGHAVRGFGRLLLAAGVAGLLALAWERLLAGALERPVAVASGRRARTGAPGRRPVLDRLPDGAMWAVAARSIRYWRRDPRYVVIVVASVLAAIVPIVAISLTGGRGPLLATGPYVAFLLALSTSNGAGYDGSAFAAHLVTGIRGRDDRAGRVVGLLVWALPLVLAVSVAGAIIAGRPGLAPACVGAAAGMLLGGTGASAVAGALLPYPVVEAGGNPFQTNAGGGVQALLAQLTTMLAATTVGLPGIVGLAVAALWREWVAWPTLLLGTAAGAAGLLAGIVFGGRLVDRRGPEILAGVRRST
jgi:ABC-2 type transport system permease protein